MHWVLFKDDHGPRRFKQLAERLRTHSALEAVQEIMSEQPDHFKEVIEDHLRRTSKGWKIPFDHAAAKKAWSVQPADAARVAVTRAELMRGAGLLTEADVIFTQIRLTDSESPWVKEAMARKALRENNEEEAVRLYREAISAGTENPAAYLVSAAERLDRSRAGGLDFAGQGNQRYVDEAVEEIQKARALDPGNSTAYRLLGRAFYVSPKVDPSMVAELERGVFSGPEGEEVRFYLALLSQRLGLDAAYVEHLSLVLESPQSSASLRERAKRIWKSDPFMAAIEQLQTLADAQRFDEIRPQLEPQARMGSRLTASQRAYLLSWLSEQEAIEELKRLYQDKRWEQFKTRAETFFKEHPKSPAVSGLRAYYERVLQHLGGGQH